MKIVSLNINSFGGDVDTFEGMKQELANRYYDGNVRKAYKEALSSWNDAINSRSIYKSILKEIEEVDADIVLFQEYYINSDVAKQFQKEMGCEDKDGKYVLTCNHITNKQPLFTVAFCRNNNTYEEVKPQFDFEGRVFVFKYEDFYIIDAHMPLNPKDDDENYSENNYKKKKRAEEVEKLWEKIREYLKDKKDEKVMFIGDLNVYQRGTHQYESFVPLFKSNVDIRDLWLEQGGKNDTITCKKGTRLDYALSMIITFLLVIGVIAGVILIVVPHIGGTVRELTKSAEAFFPKVQKWAEDIKLITTLPEGYLMEKSSQLLFCLG